MANIQFLQEKKKAERFFKSNLALTQEVTTCESLWLNLPI
jgi:hypothetical protein